MSDGSVAAIAAASLVETQPSAAVQPTAQQAERFAQQLQLPDTVAEPVRYGTASVEMAPAGLNLRPLMDYAGQLSSQFRAQLEGVSFKTDTRWLDPHQAAAVSAMNESFTNLCRFGMTTLHFQFFTKGVQETNNSARALFQQT